MSEDTITITIKEYEQLQKESFMLQCLQQGGVDNWDWYSISLEKYWKRYEEE